MRPSSTPGGRADATRSSELTQGEPQNTSPHLTADQITGAWLSARVARELRPAVVRAMVTAVGVAMSASFFCRGR